jgi:pimeloyl-ACP methyl ester carboxylesterase
MRWAAEELGAVALAMDYRGTRELPEEGEVGGTRGWQVREGAADSNAAAQAVLAACPDLRQVVLFGVSMGGNTAGLALAAQPVRGASDARPLYDWWINVEGAANVVETYLSARSLAASGNAFAANAVEDIEREVGGPIESDPQGYVDLAVVSNADRIAHSGVRGVFHAHGVEDGLVPYDQSRELQAALMDASDGELDQEFWTMLRRDPDGPDPDEDQTNLSDYVIGAVDPSYESPFVGHGSEASADNDVMRLSLGRLEGLLLEDAFIEGCTENLYDGSGRNGSGRSCEVGPPCAVARHNERRADEGCGTDLGE